ncbi:hypothetical protein ALC57_16114 [Trachymyrmex cornetzi]|uniref:Uncharacterized protein n=1 Tax=Trachymyrmex cornetzi TaxID=471704 RepID=A0A151IVU9_9HYME|nr:hypothetical protein ALC57_16114 [Trachymyrmex cornetzi]
MFQRHADVTTSSTAFKAYKERRCLNEQRGVAREGAGNDGDRGGTLGMTVECSTLGPGSEGRKETAISTSHFTQLGRSNLTCDIRNNMSHNIQKSLAFRKLEMRDSTSRGRSITANKEGQAWPEVLESSLAAPSRHFSRDGRADD